MKLNQSNRKKRSNDGGFVFLFQMAVASLADNCRLRQRFENEDIVRFEEMALARLHDVRLVTTTPFEWLTAAVAAAAALAAHGRPLKPDGQTSTCPR